MALKFSHNYEAFNINTFQRLHIIFDSTTFIFVKYIKIFITII